MSLFLFLILNWASAHGGDQPGPHGGMVMMPGAFHTEVVLDPTDKKATFVVYLIDLQFQNPSVKDSEVKAWLLDGHSKSAFSCKVELDHFRCSSKKALPEKGELVIQAQRESAKGNEVSYALPFTTK